MSMFGDLVKRLRKGRGMTLEQVARRIDSHKGYVSGIENGKVNPPSVKFIRKFAKVFQYDEREMVRLAYVDKAPKLIKEEARRLLDGGAPAAKPADALVLPLLNTMETGLPTDVDAGRAPKPLTSSSVILPKLRIPATCAAIVCDDSMAGPEGMSLSRGDLVLLAPESRPRHGTLVFAVYAGKDRRRAAIRRLHQQEGQVVLEGLNKAYPPETLHPDDLLTLFRVVGRLETLETTRVESRV